MIKARFKRNKAGGLYGFEVKDHGDSIVCAAVSALVLNCVNSLAELTDAKAVCESYEKPGIIRCEVPECKNGTHHDAELLLRSLRLGLLSIAQEYADHIRVYDEEVQ